MVSRKIEGKVQSVTDEGDLVTDIEYASWSPMAAMEQVRIVVDDEHETFGIHPLDHQQPTMTLIALGESNQPLRLHLVGDSASMMLGVRAGARVQVEW